MQVLWFCALGLKTPIHAPKIGVLGAFDPLNGHRQQRDLQKAHPCPETRRMTCRSWESVQRFRCSAIGWIKKVHLTTKNTWSQNMTIFPLLFLFAFTTACTTVQAVIHKCIHAQGSRHSLEIGRSSPSLSLLLYFSPSSDPLCLSLFFISFLSRSPTVSLPPLN